MLKKKIYNIILRKKNLVQKLVFIYNLLNRNRKKIKGTNNIVKYSNAFLKKVNFDIKGDNNIIFIEKNTRLSNLKIFIRGSNHNLHINESCIIKNTDLWFEDNDCQIIIGSKTTIEGAHIAVTEPNSIIELGKDCMLSFGIDIRSGDSHSIIDLSTNKRINYAKNIKIGDHVWIGAHVEILKGSIIEDNSVVGIRSIISNYIPSNCIAAGAPARVIKKDINWLRERIYEG